MHSLACQGPCSSADRPTRSDALHQGCSEGPWPRPPALLPATRSSARLSLCNQPHTPPASVLSQVTSGLEKTHTHSHNPIPWTQHKEPAQYPRTTSTLQSHRPSRLSPVNPRTPKHTATAALRAHACGVPRGVPRAPHSSSLGTFRISGPKEPHEHTPVVHILTQLPSTRLLTRPRRAHLCTSCAHARTWSPSGSPESHVGFHSHTHRTAK